ncbi:MAG: ABC transporter ATP-binding protein [Defluviitaleaceae bacterium]|nr:ABC transporter ATP-binding protein [Defluviitaleaceae bacterium]
MELLKATSLSKRFGKKKVLDNLNMTISQGNIVGLLGPNGAGKTTLMKTIACLLKPDAGKITYPAGAQRGVASKSVIAFLPDNLTFPSWMKVRDAFAFYEKMYPDYDAEKAKTMQDILQLSPNDTIKKLSKGMQERVALGVTFSRRASLYLLDEPLGGIDPVGRMKVLQSIIATHSPESSILLSTHLIKDVEMVFDSVMLIKDGKIAVEQDCESLRQETGRKIEDIYMEVFDVV